MPRSLVALCVGLTLVASAGASHAAGGQAAGAQPSAGKALSAAVQTGRAGLSSDLPPELSRALGRTSEAGLTLTDAKRLDARLLELSFRSTAMPRPLTVRVLLPTGYDRNEGRRYATMFLLHGSGGNATTFTRTPAVAQLTADLPALVVMPDGGTGGEYHDWQGTDADGQPVKWETFHIKQLLPFVDATFRTVPRREARAVSGFSMGGLGTMRYATRYPDLFAVAAPLSGAVNLTSVAGQAGVSFNETIEGVAPGTIFGDRATQEIEYRGQSPVDLAMNLSATDVSMYTYDGLSGGTCQPGAGPDVLEIGTHSMTHELDKAMTTLGLDHHFGDLGAGAHGGACLEAEMAMALERVKAALAKPTPAPKSIDYASVAPAWSRWGWTVSVQRPAKEFSVLRDAGRDGFSLTGSGTAQVRTAPLYRADTEYLVTITPSAQGLPGAARPAPGCAPGALECALSEYGAPDAVFGTFAPGASEKLVSKADKEGRLQLDVPLGTGNATQEFATPSSNASTRKYLTKVTISTMPGGTAPASTTSPAAPVAPAVDALARQLPATGAAPGLSVGAGLLLSAAVLLRRRAGASLMLSS